MFMEILYKQRALFPLSSCRYKAVVTFFFFLLTGLNTSRCPEPPTPGGSVTPAHPRFHGGILQLGQAPACPLWIRPEFPALSHLSKAGSWRLSSTSGSFLWCWAGRGRKRENRSYLFLLPLPASSSSVPVKCQAQL